MAVGDIVSCTVLSTGWEAQIVIEGLSTGGTYAFGDLDTSVANAKIDFTVVSEGYSTAGVLGTKTRHVYGTRQRMKAYPDQATAEESAGGGNVTVTVALSDYLYDDDNTGAGKSGTAPTVTIGAGFYTQGGTPNNATTALAVTNNSTQDYPLVIARWAVVPYQRFTSTFDLEVVAFHRHAEYGKPVACVKFSDGVTTDQYATAMVKSSAADALPCYRRTLTASDYTDNAVVTCEFTAYPWVGDADSIRTTVGGTANALTLGPLPLLADSDDDYGVTLACVNTSTGNDTTGVASPTYATANASPCATIRAALAKVQTYNNANHSRNNANAGVIYLQSNNHSLNGTGTATTGDVWVTVTRDPNVTKANAVVSGNPNAELGSARVRWADMTFAPTGFVLAGAGGRVLWLDGVAFAPSSQQTNPLATGFDLTYNTFCTSDQMDVPWSSYGGGGNSAALIRGCTATAVKSINSGAYGPRCLLTTRQDHTVASGVTVCTHANSIAAYCRSYHNVFNGGTALTIEDAASDVAVVCNLMEDCAGTDGSCGLYNIADGAVSNVLFWHNTIVGDRTNVGYNDVALQALSGFSLKFNALQRFCTKHDVFAANGTYIGGWSVLYGVGWMGNHSATDTAEFEPRYFGIRSSARTALGVTDDNSVLTDGTGFGTYTPAGGSPLLNKIPGPADLVIPWDVVGVAYTSGGVAGAFSSPVTGGYRFWTY